MKRLILTLIMVIFLAVPTVLWAVNMASRSYPPLAAYIFEEIGRLMSLMGFVFIISQYVLSSRIRLIERGIGLDKLFLVHRKFGVIGFVLILAHPTFLYISSFIQGYIPPFPLLKIVGIAAFLILAVSAGAAILYGRVRRLKYETWKNIHRAMYVVLPLGFIHSFFLGADLYGWSKIKVFWLILAFIYVVVLVYRIWNWAYVRRHPFKVMGVVEETHDTWSLYFGGKHRDYKPGQFMIVRLIRDGKASEPHPFTISSSPTRDRLSISVKSVGDFTSTIGNTKTSDLAYIDEPYGVFSFLNYDVQHLVFIAGGIGITPFMSMLRYMYEKKMERNVTLIWGNKTENDIVFREELEKMAADMPLLKVVHVMSKQDDWTGEKGYVDAEKLRKYVGNFQDSQFFLCGPPRMTLLVEKTLRELSVSKKRIHYERFALR